jgi:NRAMP (natural resistance-associated macrophage protein)-like metal ion transporter
MRWLLLLSVIGPGIITTNVDNDAGGITAYSVAGAHFGYSLLWMLPLAGVALIFAQEMSGRLGVVTGKGLADLIREKTGVRWTAVIIGIMVFTNLANTVSEFAGVAASMELFGVSKYIAVPLAAVGVWLLIVKGNYRSVERVFLAASAFYLAYVAAAILARPSWPAVLQAVRTPTFRFDSAYVTIFVTIIGTTIAPWQQFYQQSSIVDKGLTAKDYGYELVDVLVGNVYAMLIVALVVITCAATLFVSGVHIETAADAAMSLHPLAGAHAATLFALGLLNASLFAAAVLPLSTAYVVCEAFGWESGVSHKFKEAPMFFGIHTALIVLGAAVILLPIKSLVQAMLASQTLNGVVLPIILIVMLRLVNDKKLMGKFANPKAYNVLAWAIVVALVALTAILVVTALVPWLK